MPLKILFLFFLGLLSLGGQAAESRNAVLEQAFWIDASGTANLDKAQGASFQTFEGGLNKGYLRSPVWVRLKIAGSADAQERILRIRPSILDEVELHDPANFHPDGSKNRIVGRHSQPQLAEYQSLNLGFRLRAQADERTVYLRLKTSTSLIFFAELIGVPDAIQADRQQEVLYAIYLCLLFVMLLWALLYYLAEREFLYGLFAFKQFYAICHAFMLFGYGHFLLRDVLSLSAINGLSHFLFLSIVWVTITYELCFLRELKTSRKLRRWVFWLCSAVTLVNFSVWQMVGLRTALHINSLMLLAMVGSVLYLAFSAKQTDGARKRSVWSVLGLRLYYLLLAITVLLPTLTSLNIIPTEVWVLNMYTGHGLISGLIMGSLLVVTARHLKRLHLQVILQQELTLQQLANERERHTEKEQFLLMLAHEIKNPLALVRLLADPSTSDGAQIGRAVQDINAVIERSIQVSKLSDEKFQPQLAPVDVAKFLADLCQALQQTHRVRQALPAAAVIQTDPGILTMVVSNLLDNALKYSPPHSEVTIDCRLALQDGNAGVCIRVSNSVGLAGWPDPERLFQKYYRSANAHRQIGSGLGLYLVQGLLRMLGGRIAYRRDMDALVPQVVFAVWLACSPGQPLDGVFSTKANAVDRSLPA